MARSLQVDRTNLGWELIASQTVRATAQRPDRRAAAIVGRFVIGMEARPDSEKIPRFQCVGFPRAGPWNRCPFVNLS